MPYATNAALPSRVRSVLPEHAQDIYREAFNHAYAAHLGRPPIALPGRRSSAPTSSKGRLGARALLQKTVTTLFFSRGITCSVQLERLDDGSSLASS
jgi:hypothetical protein